MAVATIHQPLVQGLQFVGEIADGADLGHARTALEGVQITLQGQQRRVIARLAQPAFQGLARAVEDIHRLFEEDGHHFFVQRGRDLIQRRSLGQFLGVEGRQFGQCIIFRRRGFCHLFRQRRAVFSGRPVGGIRLQRFDFQVRDAGLQQRQGRRVDHVLQQFAQGLGALGLGRDLQRGGHLVHHADQGLVGRFGFVEEALANRQAAFIDGAIDIQQGLAEFFDLRQLGHLGATAEGGQLFQQRAQFLALGRMLAPAAQQVFGVQQDIHALGEEQGDHLRIAGLALVVAARGVGSGQALLMQLADAFQQRLGAGDRRQRRAVQLGHALMQQVQCLAQQLGLGQVDAEQVGLVFLGQLFQRCGDFGDGHDAGHVRTALEGVQGALEVIVDRLGQFLGASLDEAGEGFQVQLRLVAEDFQQLRVHGLTGFGDDRSMQLARGLDGLF
ncbi:hypothetical protein D9M68_335970 [compost metagenome]